MTDEEWLREHATDFRCTKCQHETTVVCVPHLRSLWARVDGLRAALAEVKAVVAVVRDAVRGR